MNLAPVAAADARLEKTLSQLTDADAAAPSRLPGWTRDLVVTHIARNADSNALMVAAALRGESRPQYPGGAEQRAADIEAGRGRPTRELLADHRKGAALWHEVFGSVPADRWDAEVHAGVGPRPISQRVHSRLLEVEVHHADLGLDYTFRDWPLDFAVDQTARWLATLSRDAGSGVAGRWTLGEHVVDLGGDADGAVSGDPRAFLAWLLGRETFADAGLEVSGDERVTAFPTWFPFP
ncbi:MAG: maleylpyruvate isomerase family mycothiol-dependent enzyme [Mycobacteriales bacterium]